MQNALRIGILLQEKSFEIFKVSNEIYLFCLKDFFGEGVTQACMYIGALSELLTLTALLKSHN